MATTVTFGPLRFQTLRGDVVENLGDQLDTQGAMVRPGERGPRPLQLTIPVRAHPADVAAGTTVRAAGDRLRRQVAALLDNAEWSAQPLWLSFGGDPHLDGWVRVGRAELAYGDRGPGFGEYELRLTDLYRVGRAATHRPARHLLAYDRRQPTVPRDHLGRVRSTEFSSFAVLSAHALPTDLSFIRTLDDRIPVAEPRLATVLRGQPHHQTITFDRDPASSDASEVVVRDRDGSDETRWPRVLGPGQPLHDHAVVPSISNGMARVDMQDNGRLRVEHSPDVAFVTVVAEPTLDSARPTLVVARSEVVEVTPDRAVVQAWLVHALNDATWQARVIVTLERGRRGPRIEVYAASPVGAVAAGAWLRIEHGEAGHVYAQTSTGSVASDAAGWDDQVVGTMTGREPWIVLGHGTADRVVRLAVVQERVELLGRPGPMLDLRARADRGYVSALVSPGPVDLDDARDVAAEHLVDARAVPELAPR